MRRMQLWAAPLFSLVFVIAAGCGGDEPPAASIEGPPAASAASPKGDASGTGETVSTSSPDAEQSVAEAARPPRVVVRTSAGQFKIELTPEATPITVDNFLRNYVDSGFYSDTTFHYVDDGFMIAGGGFSADGQAKETSAAIRNEAHMGGSNVRGAVAMARDPQYIHSSTSQFMINLVDNTDLDHKGDSEEEFGYCVFGKVVEGWEVIEKIAKTKVHDTDDFPRTPVAPIVIQSIERVE